jgi:hypothetical protein
MLTTLVTTVVFDSIYTYICVLSLVFAYKTGMFRTEIKICNIGIDRVTLSLKPTSAPAQFV